MGRRRKNRTHLKGGVASAPGSAEGTPKSFVIKHGQVGNSLAQLVRDFRKVMEPNTASRLRERARNKLRDFLTMAPALGVTHLLAFTLTDVAPSMRIVRLSAGPTLSFRIERYSLMKDIVNASRRARSMSSVEYLSPPLLVLAAFPPPGPTTPPHLTLMMKTFQSLFPPLAPQTLSLSSARRVVLVHYNADRGTVDFRHYLITVKPYGVSKRIRRILEGAPAKGSASTPTAAAAPGHAHAATLDLGNEKDVADFLLRKRGEPGPSSDGYESAASSASSAGGDDGDAISLADDYVGRNNKRGQKRAVKLDEVGPRMELRLIKVVEGVPGREGGVLYHEFVKKSKAEAKAQKAEHAAKEKLRKQRKEEQEQNVKRKKAAQDAEKKGKKSGDDGEAEEDGSENEDGAEDEEMASAGEEDISDEDAGDDEGAWDDDEMISEGEGEDEESDSDEEVSRPPPKKFKTKSKR
ncbi:Brix domain-containing protein [Lenzites betulinus]|nr:Brix domain-containing protein [Lenzites betulinus]